jgi:predicted dehydrogenase
VSSVSFTRREFSRLATLAAVSPLLPAVEAHSQPRQLRWCIVGLGRISMNNFMPGVKISEKSRITALVSGHRDKAEKQAALYGVSLKNIYSYDNFDSIRDNREIDAVYIALPNSMHAEYTIRAAKAGKHVLCEKPMATSIADCKAMIAACREANVKLMIAYRCHFEPTNLRAIDLIRSGALGKVQTIQSTLGFNIRQGEWRTQRKMAGGGPLMDVGIYSLNACRYLTGEEPSEIKAIASVIDHDGRFNDIEENISWTMKFPSGIVAACNTTYGAQMIGGFTVNGSTGILDVSPAFVYQGLHLTAHLADHKVLDEPNTQQDPYQFKNEGDYFADCVFQNKTPKTPGEEGLRDIELISEIYKSAGRPGL